MAGVGRVWAQWGPRAAGFRACVLGAAALAGTPRPGVGRSLSWPAAEWGPWEGHPPWRAGQLRGSAGHLPRQRQRQRRMPAAWVSGQHESPCGALGCEERRPLQGRRRGRLPGRVQHSPCPPAAPPRVSVLHGRGQRVGASSAGFEPCQLHTCFQFARVFALTFLTVLVKERLSPRFASRVTEARLKALGGA